MSSNITAFPTPLMKEGFAEVARWIALDPDGETSIYRKFGELRARSLLYKQCRLAALEKRLGELDAQDAASDDMDAKDAARTWETMVQRLAAGDEAARVRTELMAEIDIVLKDYSEALLLNDEVAKLNRPSQRVLDAYRQWFTKPYPALGGIAKTALDDPNDLVLLGTDGSSETDYLSLLLRRYWPTYREELSRDGLHRIGRFSEKSISVAVASISIVVAAFLLVGPIVILYFVASDLTKLGIVAGFTAGFALSVGLMTSAKRAEVFAATAAYAAVLVVFVSGDISHSPATKVSVGN
ncbi:hypothetical protein QBC47DRAFT_46450 [Echria macrotheca]|uniref:DUF6594 domain-containing protein n=1 Tax=Echria macrotheca TaxID=438768 RepID=A0AAJ0B8G7_9PEZI|nr:hypothetical protein QBC47DRAFT_46450 [Echria macrotheca]